ncbi:hypothetical protein ACWM35_20265 [Neobacillus sp. K501]
MRKNSVLTVGMAMLLTFGGLAACGDGVDQDNGINDGKQKDAIDQNTTKEVKESYHEVKDRLADTGKELKETLNENGVGDGVDQDNGVSDGEKKDAPDSTNP